MPRPLSSVQVPVASYTNVADSVAEPPVVVSGSRFRIYVNGTVQPPRGGVNIVGATTIVDNAGADRSDVTFSGASGGGTGTENVWMFGDGSDGDVNVTGPVTLYRDMYYNNLTLSGAASINPGGFRIFVRGILDIENAPARAIWWPANSGGSTTTNVAGVRANAAISNVNDGLDIWEYPSDIEGAEDGGTGGAGATGTGGQAATVSGSSSLVGNAAGSGGKGGNGTNGGTGVATSGGASRSGGGGTGTTAYNEISMILYRGNTYIAGAGSSAPGGSGGGGNGTVTGGGGGGGGAGGNAVMIWAYRLRRGTTAPPGIIDVTGGNGGNGGMGPTAPAAGAVGGGGGGAGGSGGFVYLVVWGLLGTADLDFINLSGGDGGTGGDARVTTLTGIGGNGGGGGGSGGMHYWSRTGLTVVAGVTRTTGTTATTATGGAATQGRQSFTGF